MAVTSGLRIRRPAARSVVAAVLLTTVVGCSDSGGGGGDAAEEDAGNVFEGESIDFVVPFDPGGGYDTYTRTIEPYLADCLGAEIVVRNEPGAGSILATNNTAKAEADGTRIQIMNMIGTVSAQVADAEGVNYDLSEFSWIGRISAPAEVVLAGNDSGLDTFEDLAGASDEVQFVATGPGASDFIGANVVGQAYELPHKVATGFAGSGEASAAVIAGDADIHVMPYDSVLSKIESNEMRPLMLFADELPPYMPEVPLIGDVQAPPSDDGQELLDNFMTMSKAGRSVAAPPGLPEEQLSALREGFTCAMEDQKLLDELERQERPVDFMEGEEYADLVQDALNPSEAFRALLEQSF